MLGEDDTTVTSKKSESGEKSKLWGGYYWAIARQKKTLPKILSKKTKLVPI